MLYVVGAARCSLPHWNLNLHKVCSQLWETLANITPVYSYKVIIIIIYWSTKKCVPWLCKTDIEVKYMQKHDTDRDLISLHLWIKSWETSTQTRLAEETLLPGAFLSCNCLLWILYLEISISFLGSFCWIHLFYGVTNGRSSSTATLWGGKEVNLFLLRRKYCCSWAFLLISSL